MTKIEIEQVLHLLHHANLEIPVDDSEFDSAIAILQSALDAPEGPVATVLTAHYPHDGVQAIQCDKEIPIQTKLYLHPAPRQTPLTDEKVSDLITKCPRYDIGDGDLVALIRATEAAHHIGAQE